MQVALGSRLLCPLTIRWVGGMVVTTRETKYLNWSYFHEQIIILGRLKLFAKIPELHGNKII